MKIYRTQAAVEKDIKNGHLIINDDVTFECSSIAIDAHITAWNITAGDITAWDITTENITAGNITAWNIIAWDITAWDITAGDISYSAFCNVYKSIKCTPIKARRNKASQPICLDGTLTITKEETSSDATAAAIELLKTHGYEIVKKVDIQG